MASWPNTFTDNYSLWIENKDGTINITEIGLERLDKYGLWIQIIDESGHEVSPTASHGISLKNTPHLSSIQAPMNKGILFL